jgi:hypothetical protein
MHQFLWGALASACGVAGLLFLKFWTQTRDRLFAMFAAAFFVLGLNWVVLATFQTTDETRHYAYFVRLVAFLIIMVGIIDKNRRRE